MYARTQTFIRIHTFVHMCMHSLEKCKKKKKKLIQFVFYLFNI